MFKFTFQHISMILVMLALPLSTSAMHTETHFDETTKHKIVYQLSVADPEYIDHVLFSAGEMLRKYGDDIHIIIAAFGPGLHLLAKHPGRPINKNQKQRVSSLSSYGVHFHACGNTMNALDWKKKDLIEQAIIVPIGVDDVMQLQEQGYSYIRW